MTEDPTQQQIELEDADVPDLPASSDAEAVVPWFHLTSTLNAYVALSALLIQPVAGFDKHYRDLGESAPDRVVLLAPPLGPAIVADAISSAATYIPVAFEVAPEWARQVLEEGARSDLGLPGPLAAPRAVIPLRHVKSLRFRTEAERDEFVARLSTFGNIPQPTMDLVCSPEVFAESGVNIEALTVQLSELPSEPAELGQALKRANRLAGALFLGASACGATRADFLRLASVLSLAEEPPVLERGSVPPWLLPAAKELGDPDALLTPDCVDTELSLLRAVLGVVAQVNVAESWRPREILADCRTSAARLLEADDTPLQRSIDVQFERIRAILSTEVEFTGFKQDSDGSVVLKALLMVLLRRDPDRLLAWPRAESGAGVAEAVTAAFICGALHGFRKVQTSLRGSEPEALQQLVAEHAAAIALAPLEMDWRPQLAPLDYRETEEDSGEKTHELKWRGRVVLSKTESRPSLRDLLAGVDYGTDAGEEFALGLCSALGLRHLTRERRVWALAKDRMPSVAFSLEIVDRRTSLVVESLGPPDTTQVRLTSPEEFLAAVSAAELPPAIEEEFGPRALALQKTEVPVANEKPRRPGKARVTRAEDQSSES